MNNKLITAFLCALTLIPGTILANESSPYHHCTDCAVNITPQGVMADHHHKPGEYMLSYNFMHMDMGGNRNGTNDLSPEDVTSFNNPNAGPANLRVVPTQMTMDMHMIGAMAGITDHITGMLMINYIKKDMDHLTFNLAGTDVIGGFNTKSSGFGDTEIAGLFSLLKTGGHSLNGQLGLSLPTGSITETDDVLAPNAATPTLRLPYAMQLGTGTYNLKPSLTYTYNADDWVYGASYSSQIHMGRNNQGYTWGDWHRLALWSGYHFDETLGLSASITGRTEGKIDGQDNQIAAPVQTADPDNYGGQKIHIGLNSAWKFYDQHTVKLGVSVPVYQNLNGPQLEDDFSLSLRWQNTF